MCKIMVMIQESNENKDMYSVEFPPIIIGLLKKGDWVTYAQVGEQYERMYPDRLDKDDMKRSLTARSYYPSLKKSFASVKTYLKEYKSIIVISDGKTRGTSAHVGACSVSLNGKIQSSG